MGNVIPSGCARATEHSEEKAAGRFMIVDAHAHIFDARRGRHSLGIAHNEYQFAPEALLAHLDAAGVDRAVLLQGPYYGNMNEYVSEAVERWPERFVGAAYLDPWGD